jgi:flagellar biosynthetic protein FliO
MQKNTQWMQWILILLVLVSPAQGWSADSAAKNFLQDVSSEISEDGLTVRFEFSKPVLNFSKPVFSDTSIRIDIPQASVRPAKRFFYTSDSRVPQIYASRLDSQTLRVQFVLGEELPLLKENFQIQDQGRALVVQILNKEDDVLSQFLARAANRIDSPVSQEEAENSPPLKKTASPLAPVSLTAESDKPFLLQPIANKSAETKLSAVPPLNIDESRRLDLKKPMDPVAITVRTFTMFALVLAFMFLIFYVLKKYVLKNTIFGGSEKFVRVLGSGFLGPKKSIVMVEVAGEVLVLGISNDNISLLTQIQDKEKIAEIKASRKEVNVKNFWNPSKGNDRTQKNDVGKARLEGAFANYLKQYSGAPSEKQKSVNEVTEMIRKNLGKLKTS